MSAKRRVLLLRLDAELPRAIPGTGGPYLVWLPWVYSSAPVRWKVPGMGVPAEAAFMPRISAEEEVVIERQASVWPFGRSPVQRAGSITLLNGDRKLDNLLTLGQMRRYALAWTEEENANDPGWDWGSCMLIQSGRIDQVTATDSNRRIVLTLADPLAEYDVPVQPVMYPNGFANASARGKPKPITLGTARFVGGTLRDTALVGADAFSFDLHDGPISQVTAAYDRGDLLVAPPTDYNYLPSRTGIKLVNAPDNPVSAHVEGEVVNDGAATTWDFKNGAWTSGAPNGWYKSEFGGATLSNVAGGARFLCPTGGTLQLTTSTNVLTMNRLWRVTAVVSSYTKGEVSARRALFIQHPTITSAQTYEWIIQPQVADYYLLFQAQVTDADLVIEKVTLEPVKLTTRLPEFLRALVERVRSGAWANAVNTAAVTALDTAAPYALGLHADQPITALTALRQALDGFCGWVTSTRDGRLTVGRLARYVSGGTVKLGRAHILTVRRQEDTAPGLSNRLAGLRNHKVHSDGEIAGSADAALREDLKAEYTIKTGAYTLSQHYQHGKSAEAQPTLIQNATDLQSAADYLTDLFKGGTLTWYEVEAALDADLSFSLEIGDWIHVTFPVLGLDSGKWLRLMGATIRVRSRRVTLTLLDIP